MVIFTIAYLWARQQGPAEVDLEEDAAAVLLKEQDTELDEQRIKVQK